jgi:hypothetical protein
VLSRETADSPLLKVLEKNQTFFSSLQKHLSFHVALTNLVSTLKPCEIWNNFKCPHTECVSTWILCSYFFSPLITVLTKKNVIFSKEITCEAASLSCCSTTRMSSEFLQFRTQNLFRCQHIIAIVGNKVTANKSLNSSQQMAVSYLFDVFELKRRAVEERHQQVQVLRVPR